MPAHHVLIVDRNHNWAHDLRNRLSGTNLHVHVASTLEDALELARCTKLAAAIVKFELDPWTKCLCAELQGLGVQIVFAGDMKAMRAPNG
jgi:ActR/RegA family two-component response regulator